MDGHVPAEFPQDTFVSFPGVLLWVLVVQLNFEPVDESCRVGEPLCLVIVALVLVPCWDGAGCLGLYLFPPVDFRVEVRSVVLEGLDLVSQLGDGDEVGGCIPGPPLRYCEGDRDRFEGGQGVLDVVQVVEGRGKVVADVLQNAAGFGDLASEGGDLGDEGCHRCACDGDGPVGGGVGDVDVPRGGGDEGW